MLRTPDGPRRIRPDQPVRGASCFVAIDIVALTLFSNRCFKTSRLSPRLFGRPQSPEQPASRLSGVAWTTCFEADDFNIQLGVVDVADLLGGSTWGGVVGFNSK